MDASIRMSVVISACVLVLENPFACMNHWTTGEGFAENFICRHLDPTMGSTNEEEGINSQLGLASLVETETSHREHKAGLKSKLITLGSITGTDAIFQ